MIQDITKSMANFGYRRRISSRASVSVMVKKFSTPQALRSEITDFKALNNIMCKCVCIRCKAEPTLGMLSPKS